MSDDTKQVEPDAATVGTSENMMALARTGYHVNSHGERISIEKRALAGEPVLCLVIHDDLWPGGAGVPAPMLLDTGTKNWLLAMLAAPATKATKKSCAR